MNVFLIRLAKIQQINANHTIWIYWNTKKSFLHCDYKFLKLVYESRMIQVVSSIKDDTPNNYKSIPNFYKIDSPLYAVLKNTYQLFLTNDSCKNKGYKLSLNATLTTKDGNDTEYTSPNANSKSL